MLSVKYTCQITKLAQTTFDIINQIEHTRPIEINSAIIWNTVDRTMIIQNVVPSGIVLSCSFLYAIIDNMPIRSKSDKYTILIGIPMK